MLILQGVLPIFKELAEISEFMEGQKTVLSSSLWNALFAEEEVMKPHVGDTAPVSVFRAAVCADHFKNRITFEHSITNVLHVLMHLLDPRFGHSQLPQSISLMLLVRLPFFSLCRFRVQRLLNDRQWQEALTIFRTYVPRFYPNNSLTPVFVALNPDITLHINELVNEIKELAEVEAERKLPPAPPHPVPPYPPPRHHAADAAASGVKRPHPDHPKETARKRLAVPAPASPSFLDIMDVGVNVDEKKEEREECDLQWEMDHWFSPTAPRLKFAENPPDVTWPSLESTFPRLSLLARRFLCILPTSASSERVWSGFGHVITRFSSNIDSFLAIKIMFLRFNTDLIDLACQDL